MLALSCSDAKVISVALHFATESYKILPNYIISKISKASFSSIAYICVAAGGLFICLAFF